MIRYLPTRRFCSSTWELEQRPYESDSDGDEFEGYLGPDDGPVIIHAINNVGYEDQESQFPPYRFRSLDSLTVMGQECESPLPIISPSLSPMHLGTPAAAYSHIQSPTPVAISTPTEQASYNYFSTAKKVHSYNNYNEKPIYTITLYTAS